MWSQLYRFFILRCERNLCGEVEVLVKLNIGLLFNINFYQVSVNNYFLILNYDVVSIKSF